MKSFFSKAKEQIKGALAGKLPEENSDFERDYNHVLEIRKDLLAIESGVKKWLTSARTLAQSAKILAKAVGTPPKNLEAYSKEADGLLDDLVVLKSVTKKIGLLDDLIRQRHQLKDLRNTKESYERKLQQLEEQDKNAPSGTDVAKDYDVQMRAIQEKITVATNRYVTLLTELTAAVSFFVKEAGTEGGTKLLAPELSAFRSSQFQFFLLCQKLIAGKDVDVTDLEAQWKTFARRMSTQVANAKSLTKKTDGKSHVMWKEEIDELPGESTAEGEDNGGGNSGGHDDSGRATADASVGNSEVRDSRMEEELGPNE